MNLTRNLVLVCILAVNLICFPITIAKGNETESQVEWKTYQNKSLGLSILIPHFFKVTEEGERHVRIDDNHSPENISLTITSSPLKNLSKTIEQYTKSISKPERRIVNKQQVTMFMSMTKLDYKENLNMVILLQSGDDTLLHFAFIVTDNALNQLPMRIFSTLKLD